MSRVAELKVLIEKATEALDEALDNPDLNLARDLARAASDTRKALRAELAALESEPNPRHSTTMSDSVDTSIVSNSSLEEIINTVAEAARLLPGIKELDKRGTWLWLVGNTRPVIDDLRKLGFQFCRSKTVMRTDGLAVWFWMPPNSRKAHRRMNTPEAQIKAKYGSTKIIGE